jgi:PAP2 superfamily.
MGSKRSRQWIIGILAALSLGLADRTAAQGTQGGYRDPREFFGPRFKGGDDAPGPGLSRREDAVRRWNEILLAANALDHTPVRAGETRVFGEQGGPHRTSRAFAIVHIAIFDAVNAIVGGHKSYTGLPPAPRDTSRHAAIAQAAHDTLAALYPSQKPTFDELLAEDLGEIRDKQAQRRGTALGSRAAATILALRVNDGSQIAEQLYGSEYIPVPGLGTWRQDPIAQQPVALGSLWGGVKPFVLRSSTQFPVPPPPALNSSTYAAAFDEVKRLGGCGLDPSRCSPGNVTVTERSAEQTQIGIYWGYDGTPGLGTPPRLYNQIVVQIADQMGSDAVELSRLLALVNTALADAAITCWETKYFYAYWRPITAIRATIDPNWTPLGAPSSNSGGPNFTPAFPSYSSGHATFGGSVFEILRRFFGADRIAFSFVSDEFNGVTQDNKGNVRPRVRRRFSSLSQAEEENGQSRIYLGIHWAFDKTEGISHGRAVGNYVFENEFQPMRRDRR